METMQGTEEAKPAAAGSGEAGQPPRWRRVVFVLASGTAAVLLMGALLFVRARGATNDVALASLPKPVTIVEGRTAQYREQRRYVGSVEPWLSAKVGPQLVSAYVDTVLVRPGAPVSRGQVIATLDCRNSSASNKAIAMHARSLAATQVALANRAARMGTLLHGGFAAPDAVEMKKAESESTQAQLLAVQAQMLGASLQVEDCVLRAPFDGEVSTRLVDPGVFARPGAPVAEVIDRKMVRVTAEVPESDFASIAPGKPVRIHLLSTGQNVTSTISRRAPGADESTRTVHVEIDLPNRDEQYPVGTTAELTLDVGKPIPATEVPLAAAAVRGKQATVVVVASEVAHRRTVTVVGERGASLFTDPALSGAFIVLEGRDSLSDGDRVLASIASPREATASVKPVAEGSLTRKN